MTTAMAAPAWAVVSAILMVGFLILLVIAAICFLRLLTKWFIDASVTQSALEEALASKMQAGGMASRMSTISQALKSRYL